jgi:SAM-dependent methyltransferase
MHRQTIAAYDADATHWLTTRYRGDARSSAAARFRDLVGEGVIVDLGCGPGQLLDDLGEPSIGADASIGMLTLARDATTAPLVQGDAEALPFADGAVAGVFANFSLQHLPRPGFVAALEQIRGALRAGGYLEVTMHNGDAPTLREQPDGVRANDDVPGGRWFTYWKTAEAVAAFEETGFSVVEVEDLGYANRYLAQKP